MGRDKTRARRRLHSGWRQNRTLVVSVPLAVSRDAWTPRGPEPFPVGDAPKVRYLGRYVGKVPKVSHAVLRYLDRY